MGTKRIPRLRKQYRIYDYLNEEIIMKPRLTTSILFNSIVAGMLIAASIPAQAQSDEYRRGYDRGYQDGAYSGRNGAGDVGNWRRRGGIEIESASYGSRGRRCDLRDSLRSQSRRQEIMHIEVNNRLCGDPAHGQRKQLAVNFRCNGGPVMRQVTDEGRTMAIVCN
ncbi:MAG: hypothetical protein ACRYGK_08350 [Janthinobacterium lividum]